MVEKKQLQKRLQAFYAALNEAANAKRARGFLGVLFGKNSKAHLARAIRKSIIEANRVYPHINNEKIQRFLDIFLEETNRPWNSDAYRERFYELHNEFCNLMNSLQIKKLND